jgi:multicomponent Na+:H+ antiporter subunit D
MLLHRYRSVDELPLRGRGRDQPALAILFALGGLALAGLPPFGLNLGEASLHDAARELGWSWVSWIVMLAGVLTGGAVLRAAGRVFLGWGPPHAESQSLGADTTEEPETPPAGARLPWTMLASSALLLALALAGSLAPGLRQIAEAEAGRMRDAPAYVSRVLEGIPAPRPASQPVPPLVGGLARGSSTAAAALLLALLALFRRRVPPAVAGPAAWVTRRALLPLRRMHSGHVGDYVTWLTLGAAAFGGLCAILFR